MVGQAGSVEQAVRELPGLDCQVVLLDMRLQDGDWRHFLDRIQGGALDSPPVLLFSMEGAEEEVQQALTRGVSGYLSKAAGREQLILALQTVASGDVFVDQLGSGSLATTSQLPLDARQFEVLEGLASGLSEQEVAEQLFLSREAVAEHWRSISLKLGVAEPEQALSLVRGAIG